MNTRIPPVVQPDQDEPAPQIDTPRGATAAKVPTHPAAPAIELSGVTKEFGSVRAVDDITLTIGKGRFVTFVGPSGCGKTTLLRMMAGLESPTHGTITIAGRTVFGAGVDVPPHKRALGMVFQSYALWPHLSVLENVAFPLRRAGGGTRPSRAARDDIRQKTLHALEVVDCAHLVDRYPGELSGGQQQRIAVARAIVGSPDVVLMDEPLSNLDARLRSRLRYDLREIQQEVGFTAVYVTHDRAEALSMSDTVVVFRDGHVEQEGGPQDVHERPQSLYVSEFVGDHNVVHGEVVGAEPGVHVVATALGRLRAPHGGDVTMHAGRPVEVAVSRDEIVVADGTVSRRDESAPGVFTILGVAYHGWYSEVLARGADGREITVRTPPGRAPAAGDRVRLSAERALLVMAAGHTGAGIGAA